MAKKSKASNSYFLLVPDTHLYVKNGKLAGIDIPAFAKMLANSPEGVCRRVILLGDFLNGGAVSPHDIKKPRNTSGLNLAQDYEAAKSLLTLIRNVFQPTDGFHYLEGNHEYWVSRYLDAHPSLEGLLEVENNLPSFVDYRRSWSKGEHLHLDGVTYMHGYSTGPSSPLKAWQKHAGHVVGGHTHDYHSQSFGRRAADGSILTTLVTNLGCLCNPRDPAFSYSNTRPLNWVKGWGVMHYMNGVPSLEFVDANRFAPSVLTENRIKGLI